MPIFQIWRSLPKALEWMMLFNLPLVRQTAGEIVTKAMYFLPEDTVIEALEQFGDGARGYYPQLWSEFSNSNKVLVDESCQHWCQVDYTTTCITKTWRQSAGLTTKTSVAFLRKDMTTRSGLFFANPYLVNYYLARAIAVH